MTTNQVRDPTHIHFTINGRHGILGAHHIAEALHIPYEPTRLKDYRVWTNPSQLEMERSSLEALFRISEGYFFGPHHLTMAALLYFEEKVHRKKLLRADAIPLLFPRLLCQILEHICREVFTLDKWTNMTAYRAEHPELPQPQQRASPEPIHEGIPSAFPATHSTPPIIPTASEPSTSAEPRMAIPLSEYRDLCHTLRDRDSSSLA
ncbi:hypothetical protein AAG906_020248 [Vitis piasezkii]